MSSPIKVEPSKIVGTTSRPLQLDDDLSVKVTWGEYISSQSWQGYMNVITRSCGIR